MDTQRYEYLRTGIMSTERYPVCGDMKVTAPFYPLTKVCGARTSQGHTIVDWDPMETEVVGATLSVTVHSHNDPAEIGLYWNDSFLTDYEWGEGTGCTKQSGDLDVLPILQNGSNLFEAVMCKMYPWVGECKGSVSAFLTLQYEGPPPDVEKPVLEQMKLFLKKYWWAVIPVGVLSVALAQPRRTR